MAIAASFSVSGSITGMPDGTISIGPLALSIASAATPNVSMKDLASGDNTLTVPTGAKVLIFTPPTANTQALILKGNASDTGVPISKVLPMVLTLGTSPVVILNAAGTVTGCQLVFA